MAKNLTGAALEQQSAREMQIVICTRTHSQMSQFVNEIKRTEYSEEVSVVPIVSRKGLCVHEKIKDIESQSLINEKCQDLCEKQSGGCPYNDQQLTEIMSTNILVNLLKYQLYFRREFKTLRRQPSMPLRLKYVGTLVPAKLPSRLIFC